MYANIVRGDLDQFTEGHRVASGTTTLLGPYNLLLRRQKTFTICNYGPATLSGVLVQVNPDTAGYGVDQQGANVPNPAKPPPGAQLWHNYNSTAFTSMASGEVRSLVATELFRWWRLVAVSPTPLTASGWVYAGSL